LAARIDAFAVSAARRLHGGGLAGWHVVHDESTRCHCPLRIGFGPEGAVSVARWHAAVRRQVRPLGFVGIFFGPTLLAAGFTLLQEWIATSTGVVAPASSRNAGSRPPGENAGTRRVQRLS